LQHTHTHLVNANLANDIADHGRELWMIPVGAIESLEGIGGCLIRAPPHHDAIVADPRERIVSNRGVSVVAGYDQAVAIEAREVTAGHDGPFSPF
jgi:hypothetical protein